MDRNEQPDAGLVGRKVVVEVSEPPVFEDALGRSAIPGVVSAVSTDNFDRVTLWIHLDRVITWDKSAFEYVVAHPRYKEESLMDLPKRGTVTVVLDVVPKARSEGLSDSGGRFHLAPGGGLNPKSYGASDALIGQVVLE